MGDDIVGLAHGMIDAVQESGCTATGWWVSPKVAVQIADYYGIDITIPEDLTSFLGLPVEVDPTANGIALLRERPGIRVAHNDPISDTPESILSDLIAELREHVDLLDGLGYQNLWDAQRGARDITNRAEARLREVTDTSGAASRSGPEE